MTDTDQHESEGAGEIDSSGEVEGLQDASQKIRQAIRDDKPSAAIQEFESWSTDEVGELLVQMPLRQARILLDWMPRKRASEVLLGMHPANRSTIAKVKESGLLAEIVGEMKPEEAAVTAIALPRRTRRKLPTGIQSDSEPTDTSEYPEGTAGRIMDSRLVVLDQDSTAQEAIEAIRREFDHDRTVGALFVVDDKGAPIGIFRPRELLKVSPEASLSEVMQGQFPVISALDSDEKAAHLVEGVGYMAVPVVDEKGLLVGQITPQIRERVLAENRRKSMLQMSSVSSDASSTDGVQKIIRSRLPWLLAGLVGATVAAIVIGSFEEQLEAAAILAAFIPVVMSMAGNSGLQASGVSVQALASGSVWPGDRLASRIIRECLGALSNGAMAGVILAMLVLLGSLVFEIDNPLNLALATSLSLMTVTTVAAIVGSSVPFALNRLGVDPATATGVFITTSNDVIGVLVYFTMADIFYF